MKSKTGEKSKSYTFEITIRPMRKSDLPFVHKGVCETNWQDIPPTLRKDAKRDECDKRIIEEFDAFLKTRRYRFKVYVAVQNKIPVGFISIGELKNHATGLPGGSLLDFWVEPECRRHGIGTRLFDHAAEKLLEQGYTHWGVMVSPSNKASLHVLEKRGFSPGYLSMYKELE
ncbi:MAG: GNAT family N-acetyltransferase [Candidatus Thermoplasmatota archaeon]|nr:GNAT family N-acetyltransferase [Euryarchaeota archaeon]MBU4031715.1 GNAT family N-acetyltransferase [Candidatus Thermoplasmatota archaeon]MBU4070672.1 GNAT family N-acetyltransferase [Candidatus Thermoplasmatota archaeon]MBU4143711.1 GNAT family N-acetyltransferase [Candidatus Thermoplasmatota archaeon]MBU4591775.1 GNAT family N-acetyltransferase [Candidatus Thermoplasmatota archaeon]